MPIHFPGGGVFGAEAAGSLWAELIVIRLHSPTIAVTNRNDVVVITDPPWS
jgi:hypothetical protein